MKIETHEVRLGNWVRCADNDEMTDEYRGMAVQLDPDDMVAIFSGQGYFEPIPLSPSILEAAGFEDIEKDRKHFRIDISGVRTRFLLVQPYLEDTFIVSIQEFFGAEQVYTLPTPIRYVHEFQNAYKVITGTELTITLP